MKVLYWNLRGLRRARSQEKLRSLINQFNPSVVWVAEPKVTCNSSFCNKLNFPGMKSVVIHNSVSNKKGNIWLFWNQSLSTPSVISMSSQMITINVCGVLISGVHAHVGITQRRYLWSEMKQISLLNLPWLVIGDFNVIMPAEEKIGGKCPNKIAMMDFTSCLDTCELMQAPKSGLSHSWSNCQHGSKRILCNLDRVVYNQLWLDKFETWGYKVGLIITSDHAPLLGGCAQIPKPKNAPLRFQKMWLSHPNFLEVVSEVWSENVQGDPAFVFQSKMKKLKIILKEWNWKVFGNIKTQIKNVEDKVKEAMIKSDVNPFDEECLNDLVKAQNEFNSKEVQYNTFMKQKNRNKWIKEGAANTSFLHANLKIRQARNNINELENNNGDIISNQEGIADTLVNHFENKFKFQEVNIESSMLDVIPEVITSKEQEMLEKMLDEEEIKTTIFCMDFDSAPGPDGVSCWFCRACWHIINKEVVQAIQFCWKRKFIPKGLNSNFFGVAAKSGWCKKSKSV
ncbi:uncharacterized protein LOC113359895 [Papaver somniferum]|uniref:uncharacterized protein LOC113359895 n=1 Tax=Papaver somniferum TaxID=3469 RepID=UPI000E702A53|nr:uncharacterized protein LOC113359895 [Papaver somniferum]